MFKFRPVVLLLLSVLLLAACDVFHYTALPSANISPAVKYVATAD